MSKICQCVERHVPVCRSAHTHHIMPAGMLGPDTEDNKILLCPNQHTMTHRLIRLWGQRYNGEPPWWVQRHFSPIARELAEEGWRRWDEAGRPVDRDKWKWQGEISAIDGKSLEFFHAMGHIL